MRKLLRHERLARALAIFWIVVLVSSLLPSPTRAGSCSAIYHVRRGDTLSEIALRYGATVPELMRLNGINEPPLSPSGPGSVPARQTEPLSATT